MVKTFAIIAGFLLGQPDGVEANFLQMESTPHEGSESEHSNIADDFCDRLMTSHELEDLHGLIKGIFKCKTDQECVDNCKAQKKKFGYQF